MKLCDRWRDASGPTVSFELFPARTPKAADTLESVIAELCAVAPDFLSVTFGAGGSTREGSYQLVRRLKQDERAEVLAYFAGYGLAPRSVVEILEGYRELGVENVLAVRGDVPHDDPQLVPHPESMAHATDLLAFIQPRFPFCLGAAGYPEGHREAESPARDLEYLERKVAHGAQFIITQYFYDNRFYFDFLERARALGVCVPIVPGVMPIYSVKMLETLADMCGATITPEVREGLRALPEGDKDAVAAWGIEHALGQCRELLRAGAPGIHIYTMDRSTSAVPIVRRLREEGLLPPAAAR